MACSADRPNNNMAAARAKSRLPQRSNLKCSSFLESPGKNFAARINPTRPMGIFKRNIAGQENLATSTPPILGPLRLPMPTILPVIPRAFPRSWAGNILDTIPMPVAIIMLAPTPWNILALTSRCREGERLHSREPTVKIRNP